MTAEGRFPSEGDVHLRIWLADVVFDYATTAAAAGNVIHDWWRRRWCTIELVRDTVGCCCACRANAYS